MWPLSKIDLVSAIMYPALIHNPALNGYLVQLSSKGKPIMWTGGFSIVFPFAKGNEKIALKIWHNVIPENEERYKEIKKFITISKLPYFINFEYLQKSIFINDNYYDSLQMDFIDGYNLVEFISANLHNKSILKKLAEDFLIMIKALQVENISHGDLQHGNIFITKDHEIKLIDYDSICIPQFNAKNEICRGLQGYQLPSRFLSGFISSTVIDHFSQLVIYITIVAVSESHLLWDKYRVPVAEYRLLFTADDFNDWENSTIRNELLMYSDEVKDLIKIFDTYMNAHNFLPPFFDYKPLPDLKNYLF